MDELRLGADRATPGSAPRVTRPPTRPRAPGEEVFVGERCGEHGQYGRADEIENEVEARVLVEEAELSRAVRHQDDQRAEDLYDLSHAASVAQSLGASGHTQA